MPLLETRKLTIKFGGLTAVNELNLTVDKGEIRALIGPNGSGKTTFINLLTGVYTPTSGEILFKERKLTGLQPHAVTKAGIARTFQNILLYRTLTVAQNVMVAQYCRTHGSVLGVLLGTPDARREEKEIRERALAELEFTRMLDKKDLYPQNLPYGRQRLVEIARALATSPDLLLLDEPAAGMNSQEVDELMDLTGRILERGITVLLVEHNMRLVMQVSHRISVLNFGRKIAEGTSAEVQTHEEVLDAYLGRQHKRPEPGAVTAAGESESPVPGRSERQKPRSLQRNGADPVLSCKGLNAGYGKVQALFDVSLTVQDREIVALLGANGAGKSTLMKVLSGLLRPTGGEITFNGVRLNRLRPERIVRSGVAHVPEGRRIFPGLSVYENLEAGTACWLSRGKKREVRDEMDKVFQLFPRLRERRNQMGWSLSGGEQQMLAIGRGLMSRPKLLLLDEPSLGLAPVVVEEIFEVLLKINRQGTAILLVEQNAFMALGVANRAYIMELGRVVLENKASVLLEDDRVREAYLGG